MNTETAPALPPVVSREDWLAARRQLLAEEKAATRQRDEVNAHRRRLPMVEVEQDYVFTGPDGTRRLLELFGDRRQLYVHHFMWNSEKQQHCPGCTAAADLVFDNPKLRSFLHDRDTAFVAISRAPLEQIEPYRQAHGWTFPWYSSAGTDFNTDYHVTLDESRAPVEMNYRTKQEWIERGLEAEALTGDWPTNSVFLRDDDGRVFHAYTAFQRGLEQLFTPFNFLDLTPYGRQEDWEDSPAGWPQHPTYG